jgi:hypothetical protein
MRFLYQLQILRDIVMVRIFPFAAKVLDDTTNPSKA